MKTTVDEEETDLPQEDVQLDTEPQEEITESAESSEELSQSDFLKSILSAVEKMGDRISKLESRVDQVNPSPHSITSESRGPAFPLSGGENDVIINTVQNILGEDFEVSVSAKKDGIHYELKIVPPDYLKEHRDDTRISSVPYIEGVVGAESYARKVRDFCRKWADGNGVRWQPPILG